MTAAIRKISYRRPWMYPKQEAAIFNSSRMSLIEAGTKTGKTHACIAWLTEKTLPLGPGANTWWVAPVFGQTDIAFRRLKRALPKSLYTSRETPPQIQLKNGPTIWFKSGDKPDSLYGEDVHAVVIDEASRTKEEVFYAVRSTLTATRGMFRAIGNVKGRKNWFYALSRRAQAGEPNMEYHKLVANDAVLAGVLEADEIIDAQRVLPEAVFKELYLAEASDDGGNPFGIIHIANCVKPQLSNKSPVAWGWDLGKSVDWTVGIGLDEDGNVCALERFQLPWPVAIARIKNTTGYTPALVDSTGLGDPIVDILQQGFGGNFVGFKFTSASKQQLMEGLAVSIQQGDIGYPDGPIRLELDAFEYEYTRTGVRYSAPVGYHDDCVCSLALARQQKANDPGIGVWAKMAG